MTVADLYRELVAMRGDVAAALGEIRVNAILIGDNGRDLADHEARLRNLEKFRYTLLGASALVGVIAGVASAIIAAGAHP